ncbi:MAG: hypothetical protein BWZ07_02904 [Alphaproteobacteria bacterium ADurb.BinA280]|nr:MAG: hypothetical protein BWZ07_02904 [Alphaproteobacteria bacterium ADurb.BinA280]
MKPDSRTIAERLQACSDDLMLADHAEVPKSWCEEASLEIRRLRLIADAVLHAAESYPFCQIAHWAEHGPVATLLAELRGRSDGASSACDTDPVERQLEATRAQLDIALTTLLQIAETPRNAGARRNATATAVFLESLSPGFGQSTLAEKRLEESTALQRFEMCGGRDRPDPIERMRLFCAQAMSGQDWFDVEPFFYDIVAGNAGLDAKQARPLADWHEAVGVVLWWRCPVDEPPYCGSPLDDEWPGYHTHWTPLIVPYDPE